MIVEEQNQYLVVQLPAERVVFPGGLMKWREGFKGAAQREAQEETGVLLRIGDLIDSYSSASSTFTSMSTVSNVYSAEIIGGALRNTREGRPCWLSEDELRKRLSAHSQHILDDYLRYRAQQRRTSAAPVAVAS